MIGPRPLLITLTVACGALLCAGSARADLPPPADVQVCASSKAGDACEAEGASGTCVTESCSRLDYSGGVPPKSVSYDCLRCDTSGVKPSEPKPSEPKPSEPKPSEPAATPSPSPTPEVAEAPADASGDAVPVESKGACSVAGGAGSSSLGLLLLALVGRRRRR